MWDATKQQQLDELQRRKLKGMLNSAEKQTLEQLHYELEQEEWGTVRPSLEHLRAEQVGLQQRVGHMQTQNAVLAAIASRQNDLLNKAKSQLAALQLERAALQAECERVLNESPATF